MATGTGPTVYSVDFVIGPEEKLIIWHFAGKLLGCAEWVLGHLSITLEVKLVLHVGVRWLEMSNDLFVLQTWR